MAKSNKSFADIQELATKIQIAGGKRTVKKTVYNMNRNEAVKEAKQTLFGFGSSKKKAKKKGGK